MILLAVVSLISVGYASFAVDLNLKDISAIFRLQSDIRITNLQLENKSEDASSDYEEYNVKEIISEIDLPTNDSYVTYQIDVTNLGNAYMAIAGINGLPDDLEYSFENYELNQLICDDDNKCNLGATRTIKLTIKPKSTRVVTDDTDYNLNLEVEFIEFKYTVNYIVEEKNIELVEDLNYDSSVNDSITKTENGYKIDKKGNYTGLYIPAESLEDGKVYKLTYKLKKESGTLQNIGGHSFNGVEKSFFIDGKSSQYTYDQPKSNLNDDTQEHIIEYKFEYDADLLSQNEQNKNIYIQVNRKGGTVAPVVVDIYDIHLYEVYRESDYKYDEKLSYIIPPRKVKHIFSGWNTKKDGSGLSFTEESDLLKLVTINGGEIDLYGQWELISYAGMPIYDAVKMFAVPENTSSDFVTSPSGIDFAQSASDTNGKGVYIRADTLNDTFPIHYYRGSVEENNVIFSNYCWKIVRTTETGGTKLIYNGVPNNGICNNTATASQLPNRSAYNSTGKIEASGYSYGPTHTSTYKTLANTADQTIFAHDVTWDPEANKYILSDKEGEQYRKDANLNASNAASTLQNYHYTCYTTDAANCTNTVNFVIMIRDTAVYSVVLKNGEKIEDAMDSAFTNSSNTTSSTIKTKVDEWYKTNMLSATNSLEDTVWCNDRSIFSANGWTPNGSLLDLSEDKLNFSANDRLVNRKEPSLYCKNPSDRFTVSTENGNGALTYPTALITLDEAALSGYVWFEDSTNSYLYTTSIWWTMTPTLASVNLMYVSVLYSIADNVHTGYTSNGAGGIRPAISLKHDMKIQSGYGTIEEPFIIELAQ